MFTMTCETMIIEELLEKGVPSFVFSDLHDGWIATEASLPGSCYLFVHKLTRNAHELLLNSKLRNLEYKDTNDSWVSFEGDLVLALPEFNEMQVVRKKMNNFMPGNLLNLSEEDIKEITKGSYFQVSFSHSAWFSFETKEGWNRDDVNWKLATAVRADPYGSLREAVKNGKKVCISSKNFPTYISDNPKFDSVDPSTQYSLYPDGDDYLQLEKRMAEIKEILDEYQPYPRGTPKVFSRDDS